MDNLFFFLMLISLVFLIVALISPLSFQKIFKKKATRKHLSLYFIGAIIVFFILVGITANPVEQKTEAVQQTILTDKQTVETTIIFDKLREWNPNNDPQAIGLEILVFKEDVTKENIIKLVESITSGAQKAIVKVYQNRQAWEEEQSGNYTDVYNEGYLAFYVKNLTNNGAYGGFNEVRWFQEKGILKNLFGTKTELK